jgi:hypothetical protein
MLLCSDVFCADGAKNSVAHNWWRGKARGKEKAWDGDKVKVWKDEGASNVGTWRGVHNIRTEREE